VRTAYVAGPLFSEAERALNARVARALSDAGFTVYLPQRDAPPANGDGYAARIYAANVEALRRADVVVAMCDGSQVDDGTAWEIGHAVARGIPVYACRTDGRRVSPEERVNLMIEQSVAGFATSIDELLALVTRATTARV
jgi:nucleoside 2-deoxyribosyltransferase